MNAPNTPPLDPKLMYWSISDCFVTKRTLVQIRTNSVINAQIRATKSRPNFSQRRHLIHPIGPQTHVFEHFGRFRYYTSFGANRIELVPLMHKFVHNVELDIFITNAPDTPNWTLDSCFAAFQTNPLLHECNIQVVRQLDTKFGCIICKQVIVYTSCTMQ
jgi:hypothetical protein